MTTDERKRLHTLMELLIHHRLQLDYPRNDVRGAADAATFALDHQQAVNHLERGAHLMFDCSGCVTCVCKWTHPVHDPNGLAYRHEGYTGTMLAHLPHYSDPKRARIGALVIFGPGTGDHVAMVLEPGDDPLLFSHGFRAAAGPIRLSAERQFHRPPVTFLSVAGL